MPFSDTQGKDVILSWVKQIREGYRLPINTLDIGPGCGTYSDLIRDEVTVDQLNAIEAWEPYIEKFNLKNKYNHLVVEDVRTVSIGELSFYEIVILGDVLEHMTKDEAKSLLLRVCSRTTLNDNIIVSFPVLHLDQGPYEGNPYETHVDHWTYDEMVDFCSKHDLGIKDSGHGDVLAWFWIKPR